MILVWCSVSYRNRVFENKENLEFGAEGRQSGTEEEKVTDAELEEFDINIEDYNY